MAKRIALFFLVVTFCYVKAQQPETNTARVTPKEFTIPPAPVFDLMGMVPSQVVRTDEIRDFKVDWSFKSWKLSPNLAVEAKPVWEILYNRRDLAKYQRAPFILRKLASIDVSLGTVQDEQNDRRIGFAVKMNIIRGKDPLLEKGLYTEIQERYKLEKQQLQMQVKELESALDTVTDILKKPALREQIKSTQEQLNTISTRRQQEVNEAARVYVAENWNTPTLDIAFGRIYTYQTDSAGSLVSLRLNRNTAWGVWINGGMPVSKKVFVAGMIRTSFYEEQLNFEIQDVQTGELRTETAVAGNQLFSTGVNVRYGGPKFSFFGEFFMERKGLKTPVSALGRVFTAPDGAQIISSSVKWNIVQPFSFNFGGDWRISRNLMLNYGIRSVMNKKFKLQSFIPVVSVACMMR